MISVLRIGGVLALTGLAGAAHGQSRLPGVAGIIDEVRIGMHAHAASDFLLPYDIGGWQLGDVSDVSFDVLFVTPEVDAFRWLGSPRPELGVTANVTGEESLVHAALTWQMPIFETGFYLEGSLGAAAHTGTLDALSEERRNLGCRVNFYERFGAGVNLFENATATFTYEHTSNADLCTHNNGLSNVGLRLGWKF